MIKATSTLDAWTDFAQPICYNRAIIAWIKDISTCMLTFLRGLKLFVCTRAYSKMATDGLSKK